MNTIAIQPSNEPETMKIMRDQLVLFEAQHKVTYILRRWQAYRVGDRYVQDLVMPGKALKILEAAALCEWRAMTAQSVDDAIEKDSWYKNFQ